MIKRPKSGGGWKAIGYTLTLANRVGWWRMWKALRSKNTCKTCAVGMGGQLGGMVNEGGHFPEVCKKSVQAMASDMQGAIRPEFFQQMDLPRLRALSPRDLEHCGRLVEPMVLKAGERRYEPISWDAALGKIVAALRQAGPTRSFFYASGRSSNEAGFLLQLLARLFGTNYVNNCSFFCHQASGVGLSTTIGSSVATIKLEDLEKTDLYILVGANPASNHPRLMRSLMQIRRNGGRVIVINPVRELGLVNFRVPSDVRSLFFGTEIANQYIQPHIGGDLALFTGIAKCVLERHAEDRVFIEAHTEGFDAFRDNVEATSWDDIVRSSGVDRPTIERIAESYIAAENVVIGWAMGITHHLHGTQNVQALANLSLLRGMVGRPRAGLMPIRGHSNVQGMGSVGVTPALKQAILERFERRLGVQPPKSPGYDTMACLEAAARGEMDVAFCLGGNLFGSAPDARFAAEALQKIGLVVYMSTTLNTGHAWGTGRETLILPVLPRDEEPQPTTQESMFSYVRLSDGGSPRFAGPRSEVSILSAIGRDLLAEKNHVDWNELSQHASIRKLIADLIPDYAAVGSIDQTRKEFHLPGRAIHEYRFPTPSGKARFHALSLPELPAACDGNLRLMTIRSEGQFNTVVYDEEDLYRGQERRDVILMNAADIQRMGLAVDQRVRVRSETGEMRYVLVRPFDVRAGNALMYYPEANVLVPKAVDPLSKTPAFKSIAVAVEAEDAPAQLPIVGQADTLAHVTVASATPL
ncbi:MAG TPA: FdhF/YdeP family oxidoreductase [Planctomycetaceae bacterium]|nr:FdhF/YdeP family oxidoreductase [Planctomycetaceae bacterium]